MARNIEINIKQQSGETSSYETLYPKTVSKNILYTGEDTVTVWDKLNNLNPDSTFEVGDILYTNRKNIDTEKWHLCDGSGIQNASEALRLDVTAELSDEVIDIWPKLQETDSNLTDISKITSLKINCLEDLYIVYLYYNSTEYYYMTEDFSTFLKAENNLSGHIYLKTGDYYFIVGSSGNSNGIIEINKKTKEEKFLYTYSIAEVMFEYDNVFYCSYWYNSNIYIHRRRIENSSWIQYTFSTSGSVNSNYPFCFGIDSNNVYVQIYSRNKANNAKYSRGIYSGNIESFLSLSDWQSNLDWKEVNANPHVDQIRGDRLFMSGGVKAMYPTTDFLNLNGSVSYPYYNYYGQNVSFYLDDSIYNASATGKEYYMYSSSSSYVWRILEINGDNLLVYEFPALDDSNSKYLLGSFKGSRWVYTKTSKGITLTRLNILKEAPSLSSDSAALKYYIKVNE